MKQLTKKYPLDETILQTVQQVYDDPKVKKALEETVLQEPFTVEEQIEICETAAPTMKEQARAELIKEKIRSYGLKASIDPVGNVIARYPGTTPTAPVIALCAHMDNAFEENIKIHVRRQNGKLYAPGISDASRALACMLQVLRSIVSHDIKTQGDILFIGSVGEEAEGDLRGVKQLFYSSGIHIDGFVAIDGANPGRILYGSTGSKRYKIEFDGPGGHSYLNFGQYPSATQALCRVGALISNMKVPETPRTTFTIGTIEGGSAINAIAEHAELGLDLRSENGEMLDRLVDMALPLVEEGCEQENARWGVKDPEFKIKYKITNMGNRPAGALNHSSPILQAARSAQKVLGIELNEYMSASTDQNVPMSLGIPSTTLGAGGREGFNHSLQEWYEPLRSFEGPQLCLLTALSLVGLDDGADPILPIFQAGPSEGWQEKL